MSADREELEVLKLRLAETERQLGRIKTGVKVGAAVLVFLLVCAMIPPLAAIAGLAVFGFIVLSVLFAYMAGVIWIAERLTGGPHFSDSAHEGPVERR